MKKVPRKGTSIVFDYVHCKFTGKIVEVIFKVDGQSFAVRRRSIIDRHVSALKWAIRKMKHEQKRNKNLVLPRQEKGSPFHRDFPEYYALMKSTHELQKNLNVSASKDLKDAQEELAFYSRCLRGGRRIDELPDLTITGVISSASWLEIPFEAYYLGPSVLTRAA